MHYWIDATGTMVESFRKEKEARQKVSEYPGSFYASDAPSTLEDLPLTLLVSLYNTVRPEKQIKKFADHKTAVARMKDVLSALATPGTVSIAGSISPAAETNGATAPAATAEGNGAAAAAATTADIKHRAGKLQGMTILRQTRSNPRKLGTSGGKSWALITEGMTVEAYLAAGGVRRDLEWDIDHKWEAVVPTAEYKPGMEEASRVAYEASQGVKVVVPAPTPAAAAPAAVATEDDKKTGT